MKTIHNKDYSVVKTFKAERPSKGVSFFCVCGCDAACGEGGCEKPRALGRLGLCGDCCFGVFGGSLVEGVGDGGDYAHALDVW